MDYSGASRICLHHPPRRADRGGRGLFSCTFISSHFLRHVWLKIDPGCFCFSPRLGHCDCRRSHATSAARSTVIAKAMVAGTINVRIAALMVRSVTASVTLATGDFLAR